MAKAWKSHLNNFVIRAFLANFAAVKTALGLLPDKQMGEGTLPGL